MNSLVVLDALLQERHITRTSERLGVSQAAISAALQKLRSSYNDELLVRSGNKMILTELAQELLPRVGGLVQEAKELLVHTSDFEPLTTKRNFCIAGANYIIDWLAPQLTKRFATIAPHASLTFRDATMQDDVQDVSSGKIDLLVVFSRNEPENLKCKTYETDEFVVVMAQDNPLAKNELTKEDYINSPHVWTAYKKKSGDTFLEQDNKRAGVNITPSVVVVNVRSALDIVSNSGSLLLLEKKLVERYAKDFNICTKPVPFAIDSRTTKGYWAGFLTNYAWHRWLREEVQKIYLAEM